jgi:hypothetical protein
MNFTSLAACASVGLLFGTLAAAFPQIKSEYSVYQAKKESQRMADYYLDLGVKQNSWEAKKAAGQQELCRIHSVLGSSQIERRLSGC